ncbi:hypothetical protein HK405_015016 [Cladochytrium tenue]|nr:hypothetical protein HK405_015016 [Cladochytrium tenue]
MDGQFEPDEGTRRSMMKKSTFAESDEDAMLESHSDLPSDVVDLIKPAVPKYLMQNHRSLDADIISEIRNDFTESSKPSVSELLAVPPHDNESGFYGIDKCTSHVLDYLSLDDSWIQFDPTLADVQDTTVESLEYCYTGSTALFSGRCRATKTA